MTEPILSALVAVSAGVPVTAVVLGPWAHRSYRRHGRVDVKQVLLVAAFIVYVMALWSYTLLPLPDLQTLECQALQPRPLQFLADIRTGTGGVVVHVALVAMNVLLFVPWGFFLRAMFQRGAVVATTSGLALSALIETTQGTGLWGIYPCAYRTFDVDDLITNTTGALVGSVVATFVATTLRRLLASTGQPSTAPTLLTARRFLAMSCDMLAVFALAVAAIVAASAWQLYAPSRESTELNWRVVEQVALWGPFLAFGAFTQYTGRTLGDRVAKLSLTTDATGRSAHWRRTARYLAGVGGFQALYLAFPLNLLLIPLSALAVIATADRRGLPGLAARTRLTDHLARPGTRNPTPQQPGPADRAVTSEAPPPAPTTPAVTSTSTPGHETSQTKAEEHSCRST